MVVREGPAFREWTPETVDDVAIERAHELEVEIHLVLASRMSWVDHRLAEHDSHVAAVH